MFTEVLVHLRTRWARRVTRATDPNLVACANGIVDLSDRDAEGVPSFRPFHPRYVFTSKLATAWNPTVLDVPIANREGCIEGHTDPAQCEKNGHRCTHWNVETWMDSLHDDTELVALTWQIVAAALRPGESWNKAAMLYSESGNNGKGTLVSLLRTIIGEGNYANIPLADFSRDFLLEPLTRASAILVDENAVGAFIKDGSLFKAVVTNDIITINRKYRNPIAHQHQGFMIQCINSLPPFSDKTDSFYRRSLLIPFVKCFTGAERKYIKDDYLRRREVLEYVLYRALRMDFDTLSEPRACAALLAEYKIANDPIRAFWDEISPELKWDLAPFPFVYDLYVAWMKRYMPNGKPVGKLAFTRSLVTVVQGDPGSRWVCDDHERQHRPGQRMSIPEPLIREYCLEHWGSPDASDRVRRCTQVETKSSYRGLLRKEEALKESAEIAEAFAAAPQMDAAGEEIYERILAGADDAALQARHVRPVIDLTVGQIASEPADPETVAPTPETEVAQQVADTDEMPVQSPAETAATEDRRSWEEAIASASAAAIPAAEPEPADDGDVYDEYAVPFENGTFDEATENAYMELLREEERENAARAAQNPTPVVGLDGKPLILTADSPIVLAGLAEATPRGAHGEGAVS
ncbi:MAG: phage/plasmid primase, P4 family [Gordonia sp. (in: high G+C Gram-positive bacteria)]